MATINTAYEERFRTSFKSVNGRDWFVSIYDRRWAPAGAATGTPPYTFVITDGGLQIVFDCEGDEKFAPIVGSKCNLNFMVDLNDTSEFHGDFIDDLLGIGPNSPYAEGDLFIVVREGSATGAIMFFGEYLMDLDTLPDVPSPYPIQLTFTDGIGKLKEISFLYENVFTDGNEYALLGHQRFTYWIGQVMQHTKMYKNDANPNGFWDDATDKRGFDTTVRWWNSDFYRAPNTGSTTGGALQQTKGTMKWSDKYNPSNQQRNIANAYTVLKQICKSWGMRVISWQGIWRFIQIREYENPDSFSWTTPMDQYRRSYQVDGDPRTTNWIKSSIGGTWFDRFNNYFANKSHPAQRIQKLEGGNYKFLPVLKEVKINLVHDGFQNVFGGIPEGNAFGTNYMPFIGNPFLNSTQFKFKTNFYIEVTAPNHWSVQNYWLSQVPLRIIATSASSGAISSIGLATLTYDSAANTYGWDDTPTYVGSDQGPIISHISSASTPAAGLGATTIIELFPKLSFSGYQDSSTHYVITCGSPIYATNSWSTSINIQTGSPYGSGAIFTGWNNPLDSSALNPPAWSTGVYNQYLSTIQPVSTSQATTNTIFVNTQTEDSHVLDWKDVYWGDGPEYWDDSALLIQTGASTWSFSDWTSPNWQRMAFAATTNPSTGSGYQFTELLAQQMKECQAKIIRRGSFQSAQMKDFQSNRPHFMNPMGTIRDIDEKSDGTNLHTVYFFRRGSFDMISNQWEGEWIEVSVGSPASSVLYRMGGGGENMIGTGGTRGMLMSRGGMPNAARPMLTLMQGIENVAEDVAITSLVVAPVNNPDSKVQDGSAFALDTDFQLKTGDEVYLVFPNLFTYKITLTADVDRDDELISFESITPTITSVAPPQIQIPLVDMYEQAQRKTKGKIAGMEVTRTTIGGAASIGREQISFRGEGYGMALDTYYVLNGEDNQRSGRFGQENTEATSHIIAQLALKGGVYYCDATYRIESGRVAISGTSGSEFTIILYICTPVDGELTDLEMISIGTTGAIATTGNPTSQTALLSSIYEEDIPVGSLIVPHVLPTGESETNNFRGIISFTLIRKS